MYEFIKYKNADYGHEVEILDEFVIDDDFIDYVNDQIDRANNKSYQVPCIISPEEVLKSEKTNEVGMDPWGMTLFTMDSAELLIQTFE